MGLLIALGFLYYVAGWYHAALHVGFPSYRGLFFSLFLWPLYYAPRQL